MAMNAVTLATALQPDLKAAFIACGAANNAALDAFMAALATAIASKVVSHITSNAQIVTTCGAGAGTAVIT